MDTVEWRYRAKIVAVVDMVLTVLQLGLMVVTGILLDRSVYEEQSENAAWVVFWVRVAFAIVVSKIQLGAAIYLVHATNLKNQFHIALKQARIWRNVTLVILVFILVWDRLQGMYISAVVVLVFRGFFLYIVQKFIGELEHRLKTSTSGLDPTMITA